MRALLFHFRESAEPCRQEACDQVVHTMAFYYGSNSIPFAWSIAVLPDHLPGTDCLMCMLPSEQGVIAMTATTV